MSMFRNAVLASCAIGAVGLAGGMSPASADTYLQCAPCTIYFWTVAGGGLSTAPQNQAVDTDPEINAQTSSFTTTPTGSGSYTGPVDFTLTGMTGTVGQFLSSAPGGTFTLGSGSSSGTISTANYGLTTIFLIEGSEGGSTVSGTISHDDGETLYDGATAYSNTLSSSPAPTDDIVGAYSGLTGAWDLVYVEANGLPADLIVTATPLPTTWVMLLSAFMGLAFFAYRRKDNAIAITAAA
jgi:hypothetical protein